MSKRMLSIIPAVTMLLVLHGCSSDSNPTPVDDGPDGVVSQSENGEAGDNNGEAGIGESADGADAGESGTASAEDDSNSTVESGDTQVGQPATPTTNLDEADDEAFYRATFVATWSADTHPINFPDDPHFSPLTGAVHNEQSIIWESGQNATDGIEVMAETGGTSVLLDEIQAVVAEGRALATIEGGGIPLSPGSTSVELRVTQAYSLVTLVSMLAPSPDWFIGVNSLQMLDQNGDWIESIAIDLNLYDAGTDAGTRYTSPDQDVPREPIALVNSFPTDSDFMEGQPAVGQLRIDRIR